MLMCFVLAMPDIVLQNSNLIVPTKLYNTYTYTLLHTIIL